MSNKIVVPEGMLQAALTAQIPSEEIISEERAMEAVLKVALLWLSENPIVPTEEQCWSIPNPEGCAIAITPNVARHYCVEWQRLMFRAPQSPKHLIFSVPEPGIYSVAVYGSAVSVIRKGYNGKPDEEIY